MTGGPSGREGYTSSSLQELSSSGECPFQRNDESRNSGEASHCIPRYHLLTTSELHLGLSGITPFSSRSYKHDPTYPGTKRE